MNSRIWKALGILLVAAVILAACAPAPTAAPTSTPLGPTTSAPTAAPTSAPPQVEEITWLEHWSTEYGNNWFLSTIAGFEAENPNIKVNLMEKTYNDLWPLLLAGAQAKAEPDVFMVLPGWMATLGSYKALYDLKPLIDTYGTPEYVKDTGPSGPYMGTYKGQVLGASWGYFIKGFYYNKDYFDKNNLTVPTTWDELEKLLLSLKANGVDGLTPPLNMTEGPTQWPYDMFGWRLAGAGGKLADSDGNPLFNSPEGVIALTYWKRLYDGGLLGPNPTGETVQQARGDFCSGKVPLIQDGPWIVGTCKGLGGNFTVAALPHLCGEKNCGILAMPQYFAIGANTKYPEAALKFIMYLQSTPVALDWGNKFGMTMTNPAFLSLPAIASDPVYGPISIQFSDKDNGVYPTVPNEEAIDKAIMNEFQLVMLKNEPIDTALKNMESQWRSLMAATQ